MLRRAIAQPSDCGGTTPQDGRGNLAGTADCGFAGDAADARLGSDLIDAGRSDAIPDGGLRQPRGRPAGAPCGRSDQRDVARPQGDACDAGAYELTAPAIDVGPAGATTTRPRRSRSPPTSPARDSSAGSTGRRDTGPWQGCASPLTYPALAAGGYTFLVRAAGATAAASRAFAVALPAPAPAPPAAPAQTPQPTATPTPTPQFRKNVVVRPTKGTIKIRLPGTKRYVELAAVDPDPARGQH